MHLRAIANPKKMKGIKEVLPFVNNRTKEIINAINIPNVVPSVINVVLFSLMCLSPQY